MALELGAPNGLGLGAPNVGAGGTTRRAGARLLNPPLEPPGCPNPAGAVPGWPNPAEAMPGCPNPVGAVPGCPKPPEAVPGCPKPPEAVPGCPKPPEAVPGCPKPAEAVPGCPKPPGAMPGCPKPAESMAGWPKGLLLLAGGPKGVAPPPKKPAPCPWLALAAGAIATLLPLAPKKAPPCWPWLAAAAGAGEPKGTGAEGGCWPNEELDPAAPVPPNAKPDPPETVAAVAAVAKPDPPETVAAVCVCVCHHRYPGRCKGGQWEGGRVGGTWGHASQGGAGRVLGCISRRSR